jgi:hypothetical protein
MAKMDWIAVIIMVSVPIGILALYALWSFRGRPQKGTVGIAPFTAQVALAESESKLAELLAIQRVSPRRAFPGLVYLTTERLVFTPKRSWDAPPGVCIRYDEILDWRLERQRQIGIGYVIRTPRPALVIQPHVGSPQVFWAQPGYSLDAAECHLPPNRRA